MGKIIKKGAKGAVANYLSRAQALKRLHVSLRDFRRLCILKGIYPRVPLQKKKVQRGSTLHSTWYLRSDILSLQHEPLLQRFRQWKSFARKLSRYVNRGEWSNAESVNRNLRPDFSLDHIVHERYPVFEDALRDLDDALSMVALYATLPQTHSECTREFIESCAARMAEFTSYIERTRVLRKTFVSYKGIFFQAVVQGVTVTWIVPHAFTHKLPRDVDFRVMHSFVQLYEALLGYVLFRLYKLAGLPYPPVAGAPSQNAAVPVAQVEASSSSAPDAESSAVDEFKAANAGVVTYDDMVAQISTPQLFRDFVFSFGRETNAEVLGFLVRSMGGRVACEDNHPSVTHAVSDRPVSSATTFGTANLQSGKRSLVVVQPQWVFDCLNAGRLLLVSGASHGAGYAPGDKLPPHLSPFVEDAENIVEKADAAGTTIQPEASNQLDAEKRRMAMMVMSNKERFVYNSIIRKKR